jgi:hypothetical protein
MMGLRAGGKSQFLKSLGCEGARPGVESSKDFYDWFKVDCQDKIVYVKAGYDYGGDVGHFKQMFIDAIKNYDLVFFVVDIVTFISNGIDVESKKPYKDQVLARLDFINDNVPRAFKDKMAVILTHADLVSEPSSQLINEFQRATRGKAYETLTKHCYPMDARDKEQVLYAFKRIIRI